MRRKALREDLSLANLVNAARAMEIAEIAKEMENPSILKVKQQSKDSKEREHSKEERVGREDQNNQSKNKECFDCGGHIQMVECLVRRGDLSVGIVARGIIMQGSEKQLKG